MILDYSYIAYLIRNLSIFPRSVLTENAVTIFSACWLMQINSISAWHLVAMLFAWCIIRDYVFFLQVCVEYTDSITWEHGNTVKQTIKIQLLIICMLHDFVIYFVIHQIVFNTPADLDLNRQGKSRPDERKWLVGFRLPGYFTLFMLCVFFVYVCMYLYIVVYWSVF